MIDESVSHDKESQLVMTRRVSYLVQSVKKRVSYSVQLVKGRSFKQSI